MDAISPIGLHALRRISDFEPREPHRRTEPAERPARETSTAESGTEKPKDRSPQALDDRELRIIQTLRARDREVRAHEQAHLLAAGGLARGVSFSFTVGPDGLTYATSGEVSVDSSPVAGDPAATIRKADAIRRAALAPANPSTQDHNVAASASQMEIHARAELFAEQRAQAMEAYRKAKGIQEENQDTSDRSSPSVDTIA